MNFHYDKKRPIRIWADNFEVNYYEGGDKENEMLLLIDNYDCDWITIMIMIDYDE